MSAGERPLTHNQLCDFVKQAAVGLSPIEEEAASGFSTVRSIALPVFRRLQRDGHASRILLLQTLLHLIAWKSASQYARQQAQRLLWMGGILGKGSIACLHWIRRCVKRPLGKEFPRSADLHEFPGAFSGRASLY